jgi:MFS family permease
MAAFRGIGTLSSGFITDAKGYDWVFYAAAAVGVLAGVLVLVSVRKMPKTQAVAGSAPAPPISEVEVPLYRHRQFITQSAVALFYFAATGLGAFISLLAVEVAKLDAAQVGILFTIGAVTNAVMLVPMGRLADRKSKRAMMVIGLLVTGSGQAIVGLSHSFPQIAAGLVIGSTGGAMFGPAAVTLLSEHIAQRRQSTAMGIYGGCEDAGVILGSAMGGLVWSAFGPEWTFLIMGSLSATVGAAIAFLLLKDKAPVKAAPAAAHPS